MRQSLISTLVLVMSVLVGCAAHPHPSIASRVDAAPEQTAPPATRSAPLSGKAISSLDQLEPKVTLAAPATAPADKLPPLGAVELYAKARAALLDDDRAAAMKLLEQAVAADP